MGRTAIIAPSRYSWAGTALAAIGQFNQEIRQNTGVGGFVNDVLVGVYGDASAQCKPIMAAIPAGSRIVGYAYAADAGYGSELCNVPWGSGMACSIGWSGRQGPPQVTPAGNSLLIRGVFLNWSHNLQRGATMTLYYIPLATNLGQPIAGL